MNLDRKLFPLEKAFEICNRISSSLNVVTISKVKGSLNQNSLENALKFIQKRHLKLQCYISGDLDDLQFCQKSDLSIPFKILESPDNDHWQKVVLNELNQTINISESLIRVILVYQAHNNYTYLITTIHHAIVDAISSIELHSEILNYCGNSQDIKNSLLKVSSLPNLPPTEALFPDTHTGYKGKIRAIFWLLKLLFKQFWLQPKTIEFEKYVPVESRTCNVVYKQIEPTLTKALLKRCREEKTTIHSALCAAMLLAVSDKIVGKSEKKNPCLPFLC